MVYVTVLRHTARMTYQHSALTQEVMQECWYGHMGFDYIYCMSKNGMPFKSG